jgi:hypothetical protein
MQNRFIKRVLLTAAVAAVGSGLASKAHAALSVLTMTLSEPGYAPVTYTAPVGAGSLTNGLVTYGSYNLFNLDISASDKNQSPAPSLATLQIQAIIESSTVNGNGSGGTLTITTSDYGYLFPGTTSSTEFMDSTLGGTLAPPTNGDLITFQSTATGTDAVPSSNVSTAMQTYLYTGPNTVNNFSFNVPDLNTTFTRGSSFDLTNVLTIDPLSPSEQANIAGTTTVSFTQTRAPEPASAALLMGGMGAALMRRRRRNA